MPYPETPVSEISQDLTETGFSGDGKYKSPFDLVKRAFVSRDGTSQNGIVCRLP